METTLIEGSDLVTAAKNIRTELRAAFPGVVFSVRSRRFAGGDAIDVEWTDGPTEKAVAAIADKYRDGDFDGMTDSYNYRDDAFTEKHGGAKYVQYRREYSDAFIGAAIAAIASKYGAASPPNVEDFRQGRTYNVSPCAGGNTWQSLIGRQCAES